MMRGQYILLAVFWLIWCLLHSLLITPLITSRYMRLSESVTCYFRLVYNLTAVLTLLPLLVYTRSLRREVVFSWQDGWIVVQVCLIGISCGLFIAGARRYDMGYFLGLRQLREQKSHVLLSEDVEFVNRGVFGVTRHPWYLGTLLLLWSVLPVYHVSTIIAAIILSLYLIVGSILEERKLLAEYGEKYRAYRREVSMLLPWKWLYNIFLHTIIRRHR